MMYNFPLRRTILQSDDLFLIEALTFMTPVFYRYLYLYVIRPLDKSYGDISTATLSPGRIRI